MKDLKTFELNDEQIAQFDNAKSLVEAQELWRKFGNELGFDPETVVPVSANKMFKAVPKSKKKTHIIFVLDSSGSMNSYKQSAIDNFNEQLNTLRSDAAGLGEATVSLVLFGASPTVEGQKPSWRSDGGVVASRVGINLDSVESLTHANYEPFGLTPMHDATAFGIEIGRNKLDDAGKDTAFLMIVITDGAENNSRKYNANSIKSLIEDMKASGRWTFQFMISNISKSQVYDMGLSMSEVTSYHASSGGIRSMSMGLTKGIQSYTSARSAGISCLSGLNVADSGQGEISNVIDPNPNLISAIQPPAGAADAIKLSELLDPDRTRTDIRKTRTILKYSPDTDTAGNQL